MLDAARLHELCERAQGRRFDVTPDRLGRALSRAIEKAFAGASPDATRLEAFVGGLHLEDLALACACEDGHEGAWEHFVREFRPTLYRAAAALDPSGGAREVADSLYGELYGLTERDGERRSLLRYFHGRSRLSTWLRSVLAQRYVDRVRARRGERPLEDETVAAMPARATPAVARSGHRALVIDALTAAVRALGDRDRLRLACYYAQGLTLAQIGRLTGEHEATVSRQLTRARQTLRRTVETALREQHGMSAATVAECFDEVAADPGALDVAHLLATGGFGKDSVLDRS